MPALGDDDRATAMEILEQVRAQLQAAAGEDAELRFQLRRYVIKRLEFDERGTPTQRRKLKEQKRRFQRGLCYECAQPLPEKGAELHRLQAMSGYTAENTRLLCRACHARVAEQMGEAAGDKPADVEATEPFAAE